MIKNRTNVNIFLLYILIISCIYTQVVFFGKSLLPNLYYSGNGEFFPSGYEGRMPINVFHVDMATPAFYEMPINKLVGDEYLSKKLPLWDQYQGIGVPIAAQYSTRVFFPYQILENISPYWLWDYFMLGRLIIAGFFTCLFLRLIGLSLPFAFLGGVFYSLSGSFVWFINLEQFVNVAMMVPVCLFFLERLIQYKKMRYVLEASIAFGFMLLAGQPEIALYVFILITMYYFFRALDEGKNLLPNLMRFFIVIGLTLAISSLLILFFLEYIPNAYHCHPLGGNMGIVSPAKIFTAIGIIIPSFFEKSTFYRLFPHNGRWDYLGGGILEYYWFILFC